MRAIFLLLLLAGCEATLSPAGERNFRDPNILIASKADFDLTRFQGDWYEVARFPDGRACANARVRYDQRSPTSVAITETCDGGDPATGQADTTGLGRLSVKMQGQASQHWVLWTDTGYRTAIIVRPDGTGGRILNRSPGLPLDRLHAALEVLDFNGFDRSALMFARPS